MSQAEPLAEFEELRPLLSSIAHRILGSVTEAEDAVLADHIRDGSGHTRAKTGGTT